MLEIEFHNREEEIQEITNILTGRPDLITFVYGPINSGKTELFNHVINTLPEDFVVFYINLRERLVRDYNDFIEALFEINENRKKRLVKEVVAEVTRFAGIPISRALLDQFFKEGKPKNAFRYIVEVVKEVKSNGKISVLILDELQKIGDVKIDDYLIYELFNLFIRLTKEMHSCHVFAVSSDSLFIERVYSEAMLHGRCRYLLVDDFDYDTAKAFLENYGFSGREVELALNYFGGKPIYLVEAVKNRHRLREFCGEMLSSRRSEIAQALKLLKELGDEVVIRGKMYEVEYEKVISALKELAVKEQLPNIVDEVTKRYLVRENIVFVDPVRGILKFQSKLDLLAVREVLGLMFDGG